MSDARNPSSSSLLAGPRPFSVTLLALGVLSIASLYLSRLVLAIDQRQFLSAWPGVSLPYIMVSGFVWALAGFPLALGLWQGARWAPRQVRWFGLGFAVYSWVDRLVIAGRPAGEAGRAFVLPENWSFLGIATLFLLLFLFGSLNRRKVKAFFGDVHE